MINTLLTPELRDLLKKEDYDTLRDFCSSLNPGTVAEFLGALSADELLKTLIIIEPHLRAELLRHLDQDIQIGLAVSLKSQALAELVTNMDANKRIGLLKRLLEERQEILLPALSRFEREDFHKLKMSSSLKPC
jgi:Mg/Co/Ni transporter MgtE